MSANGQDCEYVLDGTDTDGTDWYLCTTHDELAPSPDAPCNGYQEKPYRPMIAKVGKVQDAASALLDAFEDAGSLSGMPIAAYADLVSAVAWLRKASDGMLAYLDAEAAR